MFSCSFLGDNFLVRPLFLCVFSLCKTKPSRKQHEPKVVPLDQEDQGVTQNNLMHSNVTQVLNEGGEEEEDIPKKSPYSLEYANI